MTKFEEHKALNAIDFSYVIDKINATDFTEEPFKHLEISDLFEPDHFQSIITSPEIRLGQVNNDSTLFDALFAHGYKIITFPGCVTDQREYLNWHAEKKSSQRIETTCEGFGIVLRLDTPQSPIIAELQRFLSSPNFVSCIAGKYGIDPKGCTYDAGLQKYLDGYEISPHTDIRRKALTFMVNINPNPACEKDEHHTSYLEFNPQWQYVSEFWRSNTQYDRCWVPWDWCQIRKQQRHNNSMVIFSPCHDTLHAVKADYDHLKTQRTQLYGNLWYTQHPSRQNPRWEDFVIHPTQRATNDPSTRGAMYHAYIKTRKVLPWRVRNFIDKATIAKHDATHGKRNI